MRAIEKENKRLKDILPKTLPVPSSTNAAWVKLSICLQIFGCMSTAIRRIFWVVLTNIVLSKFAEAEGKLAGEFYTPACIVKTLVNVLQPYKGRVYDPCCGSGGMFVQSAQFIESHSGNINNISVYGQDSNPTTWKWRR